MDKQDEFFEEEPGLDGPDYVALVIEWDELADTIEDEITQKTVEPRPVRGASLRWMVGAAIALVGAIGVLTWGIHRLRAA
jgi:hypothetical protein